MPKKIKTKLIKKHNLIEDLEYNAGFIQEIFDEELYMKFAPILGFPLPPPSVKGESNLSMKTVTSFLPEYFLEPDQEELNKESLGSSQFSGSEATGASYNSQEDLEVPSSDAVPVVEESEALSVVDEGVTDDLSEFVNYSTQSSKPLNIEVEKKRKALLKLLRLPIEEAASWRPKKIKTMENMHEMSLEERGDFLINLIASNFCEWLRSLGGDEQSVIDEDILKDLFQVGMDNPASKSLAIQIREKNVLYQKLADLFGLRERSFHYVLLQHLNWDMEAEKKQPRLRAFGRGLPQELRFVPPKNNTRETWFGSDRLRPGEDFFEDVFKGIAHLSATKEYCRWLLMHPEHKKPKYFKSIGLFSTDLKDDENEEEDTKTLQQIVSEISLLSLDQPRSTVDDVRVHSLANNGHI